MELADSLFRDVSIFLKSHEEKKEKKEKTEAAETGDAAQKEKKDKAEAPSARVRAKFDRNESELCVKPKTPTLHPKA